MYFPSLKHKAKDFKMIHLKLVKAINIQSNFNEVFSQMTKLRSTRLIFSPQRSSSLHNEHLVWSSRG